MLTVRSLQYKYTATRASYCSQKFMAMCQNALHMSSCRSIMMVSYIHETTVSNNLRIVTQGYISSYHRHPKKKMRPLLISPIPPYYLKFDSKERTHFQSCSGNSRFCGMLSQVIANMNCLPLLQS